MASRRHRVVILALLVMFGAVPAYGYVSATSSDGEAAAGLRVADFHDSEGEVVAPRDDVTVVTNNQGPLVAFAPDGSILYLNDTYHDYWDVDPSPEGERTVLYSATEDMDPGECPVDTECALNVVERVNLTTGEVTRLYSRYYPGKFDNEWHDVDRLDDDRIVVADMARDEVFVVDTRTGLVEWAWNAQSHVPITTGGEAAELDPQGWPDDWTHLNDVEVLDDGRIMVSLRNQDQVLFLDRQRGVVEDWTLGSEDDYDVMFEQHNPDYIPEDEGGPAVVVADSQNNRLVEYQRVDDRWERTWDWTDPEMLWPRDADRLPNGNTLVTDTNSERVFEVDGDGEVAWLVDLPSRYRPYEAERLGTGDESRNAPSAVEAGLASRGDATARTDPVNPKYDDPEARSVGERVLVQLGTTTRRIVPNKLLNAAVLVLPHWMGAADVIPVVLFGLTILGWLGYELYAYQTAFSVDLRSPIRVYR